MFNAANAAGLSKCVCFVSMVIMIRLNGSPGFLQFSYYIYTYIMLILISLFFKYVDFAKYDVVMVVVK